MDGLRQSPKVDVCVLGGGINGLSVFRELTLQGVNVLLVEKDDYCSGASAALSRMVHGGLRYLENGEFSLVQESLVERDRLLRNAPHYVAPLPTTVPIFDVFSGLANGIVRFLGLTRRPSRRGAIAIKTGLGIYDFLTRKRALMPKHQFRGRKGTLDKWPALNPAIRNSATYYDAWVSHPERIGIELLRDGLSAGANAKALNYATVEQMVAGEFLLRDRVSDETLAIQPRLVINATGGWIDIANGALFPQEARPAPLMGGTKGSHLIIDNAGLRDMLDGHMIYYENEDGRICILFPYLGKVLVGSTDIRVDDPGVVRCEADERELHPAIARFRFAHIVIRPEEIVFQFAGVRPLPASKDSFTGRIPRDHFCDRARRPGRRPPVLVHDRRQVDDVPFLRRNGGRHGARAARPDAPSTRRTAPSVAAGNFPKDGMGGCARSRQSTGSLSADRAHALLSRYGTDAADIARFIAAASGSRAAACRLQRSRAKSILIAREAGRMHLDDIF
jgi:glycerol-3-phosphate dehydrogenase